jgi:sporulation protein YlmC with PRC-barrel domain/ribosomal protein L40E
LRPGAPAIFEDEEKAHCPDCNQPLTFVRARNHEKRWYCYGCEKYIDNLRQPTLVKDLHVRLEGLQGLQVVDSHGILIGRVRKALPTESGDLKSLLLFVDKEQFKTLLDDREWPKEFEIGHEKISTIGDVVILSEVFSPSALAPTRKLDDTTASGKCDQCGAETLPGAKHCIKCGASVRSAGCANCGTANPMDARFCKNCGGKLF